MVFQVASLPSLQFLLALLGFRDESVAEFRVFQGPFLILVEVHEEEIDLHVCKGYSNLIGQCIAELSLRDLALGVGVKLSESIYSVEVGALTH